MDASHRLILKVSLEDAKNIATLDIKNAFTRSPAPDGEYYISFPYGTTAAIKAGALRVKGIRAQDIHKYVARLRKSFLYGFPNASRVFQDFLVDILYALGFVQSSMDPCLFYKNYVLDGTTQWTYLLVHTDDILISSSTSKIMEFKRELSARLALRFERNLSRFLGIDFNIQPEQITLDLAYKVSNALKKFDIPSDYIPPTPLPASVDLYDLLNTSSPMEHPQAYQSLVGTLQFIGRSASIRTQRAISALARFAHKPTRAHFKLAKRVLAHLQTPGSASLTFTKSKSMQPSLEFTVYVDASFADLPDGRSSYGYIIYMGNSIVAWRSSIIPTPCNSTGHAEAVAASIAADEVIWLRALLAELGYITEPPLIYTDSEVAVALATTDKLSRSKKSILTRIASLLEYSRSGQVVLIYINTKEQRADIMTKAQPRVTYNYQVDLLDKPPRT